MQANEELAALRRELAAARAENARFRRLVEDLFYNLEAENMPSVDARIAALEKLLGIAAGGNALHTAVRDALLTAYGIRLTDGESEATEVLTLSPTAIKIPYIYSHPTAKNGNLLPLYVDSEGRLCAVSG